MKYFLIVATLLVAQAQENYKGRLSPVPIDLAQRSTITGKGTISATLSGNKLSITGSFEGLQTPATAARLHQGKVTGIRGAAIADLNIEKSVSGALNASLTLTPEQIEALRKGRFYVQIHSEKAPDGNLWGWLLQ